MGTLDFVFQSKGGVGKSLVALFLFQYFQKKDLPVIGVDTDPMNTTFGDYRQLGIIKLNIMDGDEIDGRLFDNVVESAMQLSSQEHLVVDNGASNFIKLFGYLKKSNAFGLIQEAGHTVRIHSIITGGDTAEPTFLRVRDLCVEFPEIPLVIWKNPYFGPVVLVKTTFEETALYKDFSNRFHAIIEIPRFERDTFGKDLTQILTDRLSFEEGSTTERYGVMSRHRLGIMWKNIQKAMDVAHLL